jgi:hypothetical protein
LGLIGVLGVSGLFYVKWGSEYGFWGDFYVCFCVCVGGVVCGFLGGGWGVGCCGVVGGCCYGIVGLVVL